MLTQSMWVLKRVPDKVSAEIEAMRKRTTELEVGVRKKGALATMNSARVQSYSRELEIMVSMFAKSCLECLYSR